MEVLSVSYGGVIGLLWRSLNPSIFESSSLAIVNILRMLSFTYPWGDFSSAEAKILCRNTSAVQKKIPFSITLVEWFC